MGVEPSGTGLFLAFATVGPRYVASSAGAHTSDVAAHRSCLMPSEFTTWCSGLTSLAMAAMRLPQRCALPVMTLGEPQMSVVVSANTAFNRLQGDAFVLAFHSGLDAVAWCM